MARAKRSSAKRYDFHSHTFLSDGTSHPLEMAQRAAAAGHRAFAITDHVGLTDAHHVVPRLADECEVASEADGLLVIPGVELTYVPPKRIEAAARAARKAGAVIVIVHGETMNGPAPQGTNAAAVRANGVDILAHPGLIPEADARAAAEGEVFLEVTGKDAHAMTNKHVVDIGRRAGARFVVNSDAHAPQMILDTEAAKRVAAAAGLKGREVEAALETAPRALLKRHGLL